MFETGAASEVLGGGSPPSRLRSPLLMAAARILGSPWLWLSSVFVSAFLLFLVQPLMSKALLPFLGGSPAVWNTAMLFFQAMLLGGYGYAHLLGKMNDQRRAWLLHTALFVAALWFLPIGLPQAVRPQDIGQPLLWMLTTLSLSVGLCFFLLSATGPLLQRWYSRTTLPCAHDPSFLFVAGNAASFLALLGYPLVLEPLTTLETQRLAWSAGFVGFFGLITACGAAAILLGKDSQPAPVGEPESRPLASASSSREGTVMQDAVWVLLAFVPSSLMLGVTQHLATDIGSFPLLWVIPLAVYFASFVIGYSRAYQARWQPVVAAVFPFVVAGCMAAIVFPSSDNFAWELAIHLLGLFVLSLGIHGQLAVQRPRQSSALTRYYFAIALGGVLGGICNSLAAPAVFNTIMEYPLVLAAAPIAFWLGRPPQPVTAAAGGNTRQRALPLLHACGIVAAYLLVAVILPRIIPAAAMDRVYFGVSLSLLGTFLVLISIALMHHRQLPLFSISMACFFAVGQWLALSSSPTVLVRSRTFYGVHTVMKNRDGPGHWHTLLHGSTRHGMQFDRAPWSLAPTTYYTESGPAGDVMRFVSTAAEQPRVAFVGLGAGTLAAYGKPGQRFEFFEIDPRVVEIASDHNFFTYLADSKATISIKTGDARLLLAQETAPLYSAIILDAFSSDAIPTHLITHEAIALYLDRLQRDGFLAFHVSNHYLDLKRPLARLAKELHLSALGWVDERITSEDAVLRAKLGSTWVVLFPDDGTARQFAERFYRWRPLVCSADDPHWRDDFVNVLGALR